MVVPSLSRYIDAVADAKTIDPPDPDLIDLARKIGKQSRIGRVSFFSRDGHYSLILEDGPRRRVIVLHGRPTDGDIDDIVLALETWAGFRDESAAYSVELPPLPESGW